MQAQHHASHAPARRRHRAGMTAGGIVVGAAAALIAGAPAAYAHDRLLSSDPAEGAVLNQAPTQAVLTFSADVEEVGTVVELQDDTGQAVAVPASTVQGADVTTDLPGDLQGGEYSLIYRVTSSDGHPISGQVAFTLPATAPTPSATPTPPSTPAQPSTAPTPTAPSGPPTTGPAPTSSDAPASATAASDEELPWTPVLIALAVLVMGGAAAVVAVRRKGTTTPAHRPTPR